MVLASYGPGENSITQKNYHWKNNNNPLPQAEFENAASQN
jgi:hypothetical protein